MAHRILVFSTDFVAATAMEMELQLAGLPVAAANSVESTAHVARQFDPSVCLLLDPSGESLARLTLHPGTDGIPLIIVDSHCDLAEAVHAYRVGVAGVLCGSHSGQSIKAYLDEVFGPTNDDPKRRLANLRAGPVVFRRIGRFLRGQAADTTLYFDTGLAKGSIEFAGGKIVRTQLAEVCGDEALSAVLAISERAVWEFSLNPPAAPAPKQDELVAEKTADEVTFDIDIGSLGGACSLEARPAIQRQHSVLIVDDDPTLLMLYETYFNANGWQTYRAEQGAAGYETALATRPDAILSDIMMPGTDGWSFLSSIRGDFRLRETPFLFLSCHDDFLEHLKTSEAGAEDYLTKGERADVVVERVRTIVQERDDLLAGIDIKVSHCGEIQRVGVSRLLGEYAAQGASGTLRFTSGWIRAEVDFNLGRIRRATYFLGDIAEEGDEILHRVLELVRGDFSWTPKDHIFGPLDIDYDKQHDQIAEQMNAIQEQKTEDALQHNFRLAFDDEKLAFYARVSTDAVRPVARMLATGRTPLGVMRESSASPVLVEWVVKDLLRKRIAAFAR